MTLRLTNGAKRLTYKKRDDTTASDGKAAEVVVSSFKPK